MNTIKMASTVLRCCLLMATILLVLDCASGARVQVPAAAPWTAPYNAFAHAPIHTHDWKPPLQQGAPSPLPQRKPTTVVPLHPSPYPFFHTLPYPLPRPLPCPGYGYPPFALDQNGRHPAQALYQNIGRNLPIFPLPYTIRCFQLPPFLPLQPYTAAPRPQ